MYANITKLSHGPLAQLAEQLTLNQWVWGSNPQGSTMMLMKALVHPLYKGSKQELFFLYLLATRLRHFLISRCVRKIRESS